MNKTTVGVKLEPELRERLASLGRIRGRSTHWLMREAIRHYLELQEAAEQTKRETLERWERFESSGAQVSESAVESWLSSWGSSEEHPCPKKGD